MRSSRLFVLIAVLSVAALLLTACSTGAGSPASAPKAAATAAATATAPSVAAPSPGAPTPTAKAAEGQPKYGGILKHAGVVDEATFDLALTRRNLAGEQVGLAYNGLLQYDPEDGRKIIPDLAQSYQISPDGKKVTFVLNKNVKWHDGKAFSSADVKFNFDRWMNPPEGVAITRKEIVAMVDHVETPDANTVDVYLKYPSPFFIGGIAMVNADIFPPQYLKDHKTMEFTVLGTGPYKFKKYNRGVNLEYEKNTDYFVPGRPYLDGVIEYIIPDESARYAAFRTGETRTMATYSGNISVTHAQTLKNDFSDKITVARLPGMVLGHTFMNYQRPPFNDIRVRQAVDMVLDRKKVIDVVQGRGEISGPMIPSGIWAIPMDELMQRPGYRGVTQADIDKAKSLLAEAGYPNGFKTEAVEQEPYSKQAVFFQDQVKAIGIDVSIQIVDIATLEKHWLARDFPINVHLTGQPIDDPDLFLSFFVTDGGSNYSAFSDKQIDDLYAQQSRTFDQAKRKELVLQLQRRILDVAATPVLYHAILETPYWKCVKNYYPEKRLGGYSDVKLQNVWLDQGCQ